jgi:hypothetical protein
MCTNAVHLSTHTNSCTQSIPGQLTSHAQQPLQRGWLLPACQGGCLCSDRSNNQHFHACLRCPSYQGVPATSRSLGFGMCTAWKQLQPQYPHNNSGVTRTLPMPVTKCGQSGDCLSECNVSTKGPASCMSACACASDTTHHTSSKSQLVGQQVPKLLQVVPALTCKQTACTASGPPTPLPHPVPEPRQGAGSWEQTQATIESCSNKIVSHLPHQHYQ